MNSHAQNDQPPGQNKETEIYVNTIPHLWPYKKISFEDLVKLAFPNTASKEFDVTYMEGQSGNEGEIVDGETVPVQSLIMY